MKMLMVNNEIAFLELPPHESSLKVVAYATVIAAMILAGLSLKVPASKVVILRTLLLISTAVLLLGGLLLTRVNYDASSTNYGSSNSSSIAVAHPPDANPSTPLPSRGGSEHAQETNLLGLIVPARDAIAGNWYMAEGSLRVSSSRFARLKIPFALAPEYDLEVVAERTGGDNSFVLGLTMEGRPFALVLDGSKRHTCGLDLIDGKPFYDNSTTVSRAVFQSGSSAIVLCSVRKQVVRIHVDGQQLIDWPADYARASLYQDWSVGDSRLLFLGAFESEFRITKLVIRPPSE